MWFLGFGLEDKVPMPRRCGITANAWRGPEDSETQPAKRAWKGTEARWTKEHGKSQYGDKNHGNMDRR